MGKEIMDGTVSAYPDTNCAVFDAAAFGLHDRVDFFREAEKKIRQMDEESHCLIAIDIEHFKVFNKWYGWEAGERFLFAVADRLVREEKEHGGLSGHFGGDNFVVFMPENEMWQKEMMSDLHDIAVRFGSGVGFQPFFGIYKIADTSVPVLCMYDYALAALSHAVENYEERSCVYVPDMTERIETELRIISEVREALEKREFTFYVQPKCRISSGKVVGGEALVRWIHPVKGLIPPGIFVPLLEKNGFIGDLDRYVWEEVCRALRDWIDQGIRPVPISINVSRMDILSMDVVAFLLKLVGKYKIKRSLLKIEITESAYTENVDRIVDTIRRLREEGFTILMDDFGSGYSSLNMLKSAMVDVIKIDMRFLDMSEDETQKGIGILESVINMSSTMGIPVIVEGVETKKQEDYLVGMGCRYAQGYYYYRPMPADEFGRLIGDGRNLDYRGIYSRQVEQLHLREMMDASLFGDTLLNNILGPVVFYDMYDNDITITRVNNLYYRMAIGEIAAEHVDPEYTKRFWRHIPEEDRANALAIFQRASDNPLAGADGEGHFICADGSLIWIRIRIFLLREQDGHKLFFGMIPEYHGCRERTDSGSVSLQSLEGDAQDFTAAQLAQCKENFDHLPIGFAIAKILLDGKGRACDYEIIYANRNMIRISNSDAGRIRLLGLKLFADDLEGMYQKCYEAAYRGSVIRHTIYSPVSSRYLQMTIYQYKCGYIGAVVQDVTKPYIYESVLKSTMITGRKVYFVHLEDDYYRMLYPDENSMLDRGVYSRTIRRMSESCFVRQGREVIHDYMSIEGIRRALQYRNAVEYCYGVTQKDGTDVWCIARYTVGERQKGVVHTVAVTVQTVEDVSKWKQEQEQITWWKY